MHRILSNTTNTTMNPLSVEWADSFFSRFLGLMGRKEIFPNTGLVLVLDSPSKLNAAIHMLFMRFDIATIWISPENIVIDKVLAKKWHLSYQPKAQALYVLETHPDNFVNFSIGDQISFKNEK